jgi:hypothetical protein
MSFVPLKATHFMTEDTLSVVRIWMEKQHFYTFYSNIRNNDAERELIYPAFS